MNWKKWASFLKWHGVDAMIYLVHYLDGKGESSHIKVEAESREEARLLSRIPERRIQQVREDLLGRIGQALEPPGPPAKAQAVFMQTLSSTLATGKPVRESIERLLAESAWLKPKPEELASCEELVDFLKLFRFNRNALLLAETAKQTGRYVDALQKASQYLLTEEKMKSDVANELKTGITYIILGALFFLLVPLFIGNSLYELGGVAGAFKANTVTEALMIWGGVINDYWFIPLVLSPIILWYRAQIWVLVRGLPFLRVLNQKRKMDRAVRFVSAYRMLHEVGMVDSDSILSLMQASHGEDKIIYKRMFSQLASSKDLGGTFDKDDWPLALRETMSVYGSVDEQEQNKILDTLFDTLQMENVHLSRAISKILSRTGFFLMVSCVLAAIVGFYLPIISGATSGGIGGF